MKRTEINTNFALQSITTGLDRRKKFKLLIRDPKSFLTRNQDFVTLTMSIVSQSTS